MKAVVIGESSEATMDEIMAVYPRHKAVVDAYFSVFCFIVALVEKTTRIAKYLRLNNHTARQGCFNELHPT